MTSNKKRVRLSDIIGPAFYETHKLIDMGVIDEAVESGGRASLKSSYVGTEVVLQLVKHPDCHALVTRQVGDTMRDSVYAQILWAIDKLGLTTKFKCTQSPLQCTYLPTGQRILFRGLDDPQKIKSIKLPFGYIGILWFEEADQIKGGEDAVRNVQQSALRGGEFGLTFISFNPPAASRNWANRYAREERKGKRIIRPTCKPLLHGSARSFWRRRSTSRKRSRRNTAMNIWARSSAAARRYLKICGLSLSRKRLSETSTPLKTVLTGAGIPTRGRSTAATMMRHAKRCISSTN